MALTTLKLTREQLAIITGGDPRAIKAFEDFISAVNNLGAHASTHQPGGSDPLTVDAAAAVGSLRTLGTGALKAAAGIHAGTHVTGGGDTIADAVAAGNSGLLSGADKTKLDTLVPDATKAPLPQTAAGVGKFDWRQEASGAAWVLGAGGMWIYSLLRRNVAVNTITNQAGGGPTTGGTTVGAAAAGEQWFGWAWRIA